jgi:hypothetical protein
MHTRFPAPSLLRYRYYSTATNAKKNKTAMRRNAKAKGEETLKRRNFFPKPMESANA